MPSPLFTAVFIHGLPETKIDPETNAELFHKVDRFAFFRPLIEYTQALGGAPILIPGDIVTLGNLRGLIFHNQFDELAEKFEEWITGLAEQFQDKPWIICAHSGGGLVLYKWLVTRSNNNKITGPKMLFVFDAPHCIVSTHGMRTRNVRLPSILTEDGERVSTRIPIQEYIKPRELLSTIAGQSRLCIFADGADTFLSSETCFDHSLVDNEFLSQHILDGSGHSGICSNDRTLRIYVRALQALRRL